ncbi:MULTISPECIES: hypothetical protein [unclassified Ensifer]|uniref:hypothetical protein n=1 Tax=unclassified Ensifer TaxID=2633371 RepID=UPI000812DAD8|nr:MULTISPECIES: hypothetical protein [unclassified Ensifer]OCP10216.1 hypothetical protein BC374_18405 [Ensifer sp. LC13]OCP14713.1 hypothetical protein BC362_00475 [Ensifer sp. LC14]OCP33174.1 hypothetical protein BC364_17505 [Ensifer sp. LC499]
MDTIATLVSNAQTPTGGVFVLSAIILFGFLIIAPKVTADSPFAPYVLPLLGIMIVVPATMFLGVTKVIESDAVAAVIGAVVAYIFTRAQTTPGAKP